jgi:spermidine synthase
LTKILDQYILLENKQCRQNMGFLLAFEGFIGLTYQILFFRQLTSEVGSSFVINGIVIGFFLAALSIGYITGGRPTTNPRSKLGKNFILAALFAAIGMSSLFVSVFFGYTTQYLGRIAALGIYGLLIVSPVAYLMGQSLPLILQINKAEKPSDSAMALFLSTFGSFVGATIPVIFITPYLGATLTLTLTASVAFIVGLYLCWKNTWHHWLSISGFILLQIPLSSYYIFPDGQFASTQYSDIYFSQTENHKIMMSNNTAMSIQNKDGTNAADYINKFHAEILEKKITHSPILILGAGGFMAHTKNTGANHFTYVEIDADLASWAKKHFNFNPDSVSVVIDDARSFLLQEPDNKWALIYLDTFSARYSMPEHLITHEFFRLLESKLAIGGVAMLNTIMSADFNDTFSRKLHTTITSVFPYCQVSQVGDSHQLTNVHYTCFAHRPIENTYTDDKNTVSMDILANGTLN